MSLLPHDKTPKREYMIERICTHICISYTLMTSPRTMVMKANLADICLPLDLCRTNAVGMSILLLYPCAPKSRILWHQQLLHSFDISQFSRHAGWHPIMSIIGINLIRWTASYTVSSSCYPLSIVWYWSVVDYLIFWCKQDVWPSARVCVAVYIGGYNRAFAVIVHCFVFQMILFGARWSVGAQNA